MASKEKNCLMRLKEKPVFWLGWWLVLLFGLFGWLVIAGKQAPEEKVMAEPEKKKAILHLEAENRTLKVGETVEVKVILDTGDYETDATDVWLNYDPKAVMVTKVTEGKIYDSYPAKRIDANKGVVVVNGITSLTKTFKGRDVFAVFTVKALKKGKTGLIIEFTSGSNTDSNVVATKISKDILGEAEGIELEIN